MFKTLKNALKVKDIRKGLMFTFFIMIVVRLGSLIPVPGLDTVAVKDYLENALGDANNFLSSFTGGSFTQMSIFALNVTPYITSSIIMQLLTIAIPKLGCGLDKLEWDKVKKLIENIFSDIDIKIIVCSL